MSQNTNLKNIIVGLFIQTINSEKEFEKLLNLLLDSGYSPEFITQCQDQAMVQILLEREV